MFGNYFGDGLPPCLRYHRLNATKDQIASTIPNGQAPWRKPYIDPSMHDKANPKIYQRLRASNAQHMSIAVTANNPNIVRRFISCSVKKTYHLSLHLFDIENHLLSIVYFSMEIGGSYDFNCLKQVRISPCGPVSDLHFLVDFSMRQREGSPSKRHSNLSRRYLKIIIAFFIIILLVYFQLGQSTLKTLAKTGAQYGGRS